MIIRKLRLHPFGGIIDRTLEFKAGINVISGENDIGKTTTFRAIDAALFISVNLSKSTSEGKEFAKTCIPIGGDHAAVTLEFEVDGKIWTLEKTWGPDPKCRLTRPDKTSVSTLATVEKELLQLFPCGVATFRTVLLSRQGELVETIADLDNNPVVMEDLGGLLRAALSQVGGVSVERLKGTIAEKITDHFGKWDRTLNQPEKNRGIENPWVTGKGTLLDAYYGAKRLTKAHFDVEQLEARLAKISGELGAAEQELEKHRDFVQKNTAIMEADGRRGELEMKLQSAERESKECEEDYRAWIKADVELGVVNPQLETAKTGIESLDRELKLSNELARSADLRGRLKQAQLKFAECEVTSKVIAGLPVVRAEDMQSLRDLTQSQSKLQAGLEAGRLKVAISAKKLVSFSIGLGLSPVESKTLEAGARLELSAAGRVRFENDLFTCEVLSGEEDFETLEREFNVVKAKLADLFLGLGCQDLAEAGLRCDEITKQNQLLRTQESGLKIILGTETLETLTEKVKATGLEAGVRDFEVVQSDLKKKQIELGGISAVQGKLLALIAGITRKHKLGAPDDLLTKLSEKKQEFTQAKAALGALPPLPADITDREVFRSRYRQAQASQTPLSEKIRTLSSEKAGLRFPDESEQELLRQKRDADAHFEEQLKKGRALIRVEAVMRTLDEKSGDVFSALQNDFEALLKKMTGTKYGNARLENGLPSEFTRASDGVAVPFRLLSAGIKDGVALSFRIAMARYFLGKTPGPILVDDPMVSMDQTRQAAAAGIIRDFSRDKQQVLFFTCHEAHAVVLGENHRVAFCEA